METRRSTNPEFLIVRVEGAANADGLTVHVNGQKKEGVDIPVMVTAGIHQIEVSGFRPKQVDVKGGTTDIDFPAEVVFRHPEDGHS